jgi:CheY-like chemotaxis protein
MAERILVVEDDASILEMTSDILRASGYEVLGVRHPDLVLQIVDRERPDLIVLDIMLPRMSGVEVADKLWVNGFGTIPIVGVSASGIMTDLANQTPFFASVIRKPFELDTLLRSVHDALVAAIPTLEVAEITQPV